MLNRWLRRSVLGATVVVLGVGCGEGAIEEGPAGALETDDAALSSGQKVTSSDLLSVARGALLFNADTFRGNGRTCSTCHAGGSGTLNPQQLQRAFQVNPSAAIFRSIDSDDGVGNSYSRLLADASILVGIPLPANISLVGSPSREVTLARGIPSTMNSPALDPVLMLDGRQPNLPAQAASAITAHAQAGRTPSSRELQDIANFEKTLLFNRPQLALYAAGGPAPKLPEGRTASEKRGRVFFVDDNPGVFRCVHCHTGPMLNQTSLGFQQATGLPAGSRFANIAVSEFNAGGRPVKTYEFHNPDGSSVQIPSSDPGRALITGNPADIGAFKIPTVWAAKDTAPFFHDNSAKSLEALLEHYDRLGGLIGPTFDLSEQDKADIIAFVKLL